MAIWLWFIAKYTLPIWRQWIAKCTLAIRWQPIAKKLLAILANSYCLNRNNRGSSFYKTRGSKLCFLTCFSYFSCYFLILVFFTKSLLTNFFVPISAARESDFLSCFVPLVNTVVRCTCLPIFQAHNMWVSWSETLSAFRRRFLVQTFVWQMRIIPFILTKILGLILSHAT
jgi:hypothetical protein